MDIVATQTSLPATPVPKNLHPDVKAWHAAQDFEAVLIGELTGHMFKTSSTGGSFSGGEAEDTWRGILAEQVGKEISRSGGVGIASSVYSEIIKLQGGAR